MGACGSSLTPEEKEAARKNKELEVQIKNQERIDSEKVKLLLLGAGESGKSTIFKQMKVIYGEKYNEKDGMQQLSTIYGNILQAMKVLIEQSFSLKLDDQVIAKDAFDLIRSVDECEPIDIEVGDAIKTLWADPGIIKVWDRRNEFQIIESVKYYFDKIDEIKQPDYIPSQNDVLMARVRTSGIVTERYNIDDTTFEMYDVGGQRNERKKWIHCFEGVTAVIFVAAISEYDQKLFEDGATNRMVEALELFDDICNNAFFANSAMILFLNKRDLFEDKIKKIPIKDVPYWDDYTGDNSYEDGVNYFVEKFMSLSKSSDREIYQHVTCATDTANVKVTLDACKDIILRKGLESSGFA